MFSIIKLTISDYFDMLYPILCPFLVALISVFLCPPEWQTFELFLTLLNVTPFYIFILPFCVI